MPERGQVTDRSNHDLRFVLPDRWYGVRPAGTRQYDGRETEARERIRPRVVYPQVDDEDAASRPFSTDRMRSRVATDSPGRSLRAKDTAPRDTPAFRAISTMVTRVEERFLSGSLLLLTR